MYKMADKCLKGKVVVITGATTGFGEASAVEFAKHGAKLVICGRNLDGLENTKQQCVQQGIDTGDVTIVTGDVLKDETLDLIMKTTVDTYGKVDILHLSAGKLHPVNGPVTSAESIESLDYYYEMYVKYQYKLTQKMSAELIKSKGNIVITSGIIGGGLLEPNFSGVGIMEAGQYHMTKLFALTFANKGVRVNLVNPGFVRTYIGSDSGIDSFSSPDAEGFTFYEGHTPLGSKLATPEEVARVVVFLASSQSACMTGGILTMDKGCTLIHPAVNWKEL